MSYFHRTVFLGHDISLFLPHANWKWAVEIAHELEVDIEEGRTGREDRTPRHTAWRLEQTARFTLTPDDAEDLQAALLALGTAFIGMPLYPDVRTPDRWAARIYNAEYVLNYDETGYTIYARDAVPGSPARRYLAPLLVGRLHARPRLTPITKDMCQLSMQLNERSPWNFYTSPRAVAVESTFPAELVPNSIEPPEDWTEDMLEYTDIGAGREQAIEGEEGTTARAQRLFFTLKNAQEIGRLLNFYRARNGMHASFGIPWEFQPGGVPFSTKVRFAESRLVLSFKHGEHASTTLSFVELPWEIAGVGGETPARDPVFYLYRYTRSVPGGPLYWRYTDYEFPVTRAGDGDYTPATIEHDQIVQTINLDDPATRLSDWIRAGNPLIEFLKRNSDVPLLLEIFEFTPGAPVDARLVYSADVADVSSKGRSISATTKVLGGALAIKVPNFYFGPTCNYEFCETGCGLDPAAWTFTGAVVSQVGTLLTLNITANPPGAAVPTNYFAKGWVKKGAGANYEVRQIVVSTNLGGVSQRFTLKRPFTTANAADVITFRPYCTGTRNECDTKYGNYINFGAHPHIGARNISLPKMETQSPSGKK